MLLQGVTWRTNQTPTCTIHVLEAKLNLRAWASNHQLLMETAQQVRTTYEKKLTNILGIHWDRNTNWLSLSLKSYILPAAHFTTKQELLQDSSKPFDPLTMVSPVSVCAKLLTQQLWKQFHMGWTTKPGPRSLLTDWMVTFTNICRCANIFIELQHFNTNFT